MHKALGSDYFLEPRLDGELPECECEELCKLSGSPIKVIITAFIAIMTNNPLQRGKII